jgi:nucleoside triphosphate diphosphatase
MNDPTPPTPAESAAAGPFPKVEGVLDRSLALVEYLRAHCPWDRKQTALSLVPHLLEETHETVDAIQEEDWPALEGELGDLLLNLAFQVVVGEEDGRLSRDGVVRHLEEKMIRRHPHLFGLGDKEAWEAIKAREREGSGTGVLEGLAEGLDPLLRAHRIQEKAAGVGFDWNEARGALGKVKEELEEVEEAMAAADQEGDSGHRALQEEMGDLLFAVVNLARLAGAPAVPALVRANAKFRRRFQRLEVLAREQDLHLPGTSLEELDALWDRVKREEGHEIV